MAWYPGATRMARRPESDAQTAIRPTQFIVHSPAPPWAAKHTFEHANGHADGTGAMSIETDKQIEQAPSLSTYRS